VLKVLGLAQLQPLVDLQAEKQNEKMQMAMSSFILIWF